MSPATWTWAPVDWSRGRDSEGLDDVERNSFVTHSGCALHFSQEYRHLTLAGKLKLKGTSSTQGAGYMIDSVSASIRAPWQFGCLVCPLLFPSIATYPPGVKTCCLHGCILSPRLLFFSFHQKDNNDASSHTSPTHSFSHCVVSATSLGNKHRLQLTHFGDFLDALLHH